MTDQGGNTIGVATLEDDEAATETGLTEPAPNSSVAGVYWQCFYHFTVDGLADASFYKLKIGRRDGPTYSAADLETMNWSTALTLGD